MKTIPVLICLLLLPLCPLLAQTTGTGTTTGTTTVQPSAATTTGTAGTTTPAASSTAASSNAPDLSVPVDKKDTWVVGFTVFAEDDVSPDNQYLSSSVALLLKNELAGIATHTLTDEERDLVRKAAIKRELDAAAANITSLHQQRDSQFLDTSPASASALASFNSRIDAAEARVRFLQGLDPSRVVVADSKPLVVKAGTGAGNLLDAPQVPASVSCARNGLDMLVGGTIHESEGYILVDTWAYDALRDQNTFTYRDASLREETYATLPGIGSKLAGLFLGKPWATIAFAPNPPESSLFLDGKLVATGTTPTIYVSPGTREVRISAAGYKDISRIMTLAPEEQTSLNVTLDKLSSENLVISSTPPGADVYLESVWKGRTPLALEKPFERSRVVLSEKGFYDMPFSISASSPAELSFTLLPSDVSRDAIQRQARDDFYASFMWFAISLPIPFFCYAFALDQAVAVQQLGSGPQAVQAQALGNTLYTGYLVGTAVSVGLFTWMLFKIIHYVSVSTRTAG